MNLSSGSRTKAALRTGALTTVVAALVGGALVAAPAHAEAESLTLINSASTTWKYLQNNTDPAGSDADTKVWTKTPYVDSAWQSAKGSFGFKNGGATGIGPYTANTLLTRYITGTTDDIPTYFFRTNVELTADQLSGIVSINASVIHDDALQVYVNGTKAVGVDDSTVTQNLQYAGVSAGDPKTANFTVDKSLLHAGTNTVAVALYQDRASSSDAYFDFTSLVAQGEDDSPAAISDLNLNIGSDETQRGVVWYSNSGVTEQVQLARKSDVVGDDFPEAKAASFIAANGATTAGGGLRSQQATITGLVENTDYVYRVGSAERGWSATYEFATQGFGGDFSFLLAGDAQIGASGNVARDQAGWVDTLNKAEQMYPDTSFIYSAGDQVNTASSEAEYDAFLAPEQLRSIPVSTLNGNHDVGSKAYEQHFLMPNWDPSYGAASSGTSSGGDHWFTYNDVLYISLNSNSQDNASHEQFLRKVVAEQGDKVKWKVVGFHHSIYSVASHANDSDIISRRAALPSIISDLDIDLVLMGHDHAYTRTYLMQGGSVAEDVTGGAKSEVTAEDGEVLYVTANSASGSKYYDIRNQDFPYAAVMNQEYVPNISNIDVTDDSITVSTFRTTDMTVVDKVTLRQADVVAPELTVPADSQIKVGDTFDGLAGVTATDAVDGDLTSAVTVFGSVDTTKTGAYTLSYSVKDAAGNTTTATRTITVVEGEFVAGAKPAISGSATVGKTVTATSGDWTPTPSAASFQWLRNGSAISGATSATYAVTAADAGKALSVRVTATHDGYLSASAESSAVTVAKGALSAAKPSVSGTFRVGSKLTAKAGSWSPAATLSYRWYANGTAISGATKSSYTLSAATAGKKVTVTVTGTRSGYTTKAVSSTSRTVAKGVLSGPKPTIKGTAKVGKKLTVKVGSWKPAASTKVRWYANGKAISGATKSSLKLTTKLKGKKITVKVTGSKSGYATKVVTSKATSKVTK